VPTYECTSVGARCAAQSFWARTRAAITDATRQHIGESTGFVMARYNLSQRAAFDRIV